MAPTSSKTQRNLPLTFGFHVSLVCIALGFASPAQAEVGAMPDTLLYAAGFASVRKQENQTKSRAGEQPRSYREAEQEPGE